METLVLEEKELFLAGKHPLRLTALCYLRHALLKENYEMCAEIIEIGKEFDASDLDIKIILEDPRRIPK